MSALGTFIKGAIAGVGAVAVLAWLVNTAIEENQQLEEEEEEACDH